MGLATSHERLHDQFEPDPIVRVKRNHLLYDQRIVPDASSKNIASDAHSRLAKIVEYRTDMESGKKSGRYGINRSNQSEAHILTMRKFCLLHQSSVNDWRKGCEKLLVGDCNDSKAPHGDGPLQLQGLRVHRIFDMINLKPVESHEQLRRIMSHLPGWVSKDCGLESSWIEYRFTSSSSLCYERIWLPWPDLREASQETLDSFVRAVNGVERRNVFEVWWSRSIWDENVLCRTWTIYHNPLYAAGRLSLVLSPRKLSKFQIISDMCEQEMFAMEMRAHLHHICTPGYRP